jgi:hypothetical protein
MYQESEGAQWRYECCDWGDMQPANQVPSSQVACSDLIVRGGGFDRCAG